MFYISIFQFCCKNYAGLSIQYFKTKTILKLYLPKKANKYNRILSLLLNWIQCKSKGSCSSTNHICAEKSSFLVDIDDQGTVPKVHLWIKMFQKWKIDWIVKNYVCPIFISIQGFVTMRKSFGLVTSFFRSLFSTSMSMVDLSVQKLFPLGWVFETASCSLKHLMMQNCESAVALRKMFASYSFTISFKRCLILKVLNWENRFC